MAVSSYEMTDLENVRCAEASLIEEYESETPQMGRLPSIILLVVVFVVRQWPHSVTLG